VYKRAASAVLSANCIVLHAYPPTAERFSAARAQTKASFSVFNDRQNSIFDYKLKTLAENP